MPRLLSVLLLSVALTITAATATAGELAGVTMPDTSTVGGAAVSLNGLGLRKVLFIKVYVIGLYTEKPARTEAEALNAGAWKADLHFLRGLEPQKITDGIQDGFERNSAAQIGALQARLDTFKTFFTKVVEGDVAQLAWEPGKGTVVRVNGSEKGVVPGKDFADALLKVWLGGDPVQEDIKAGMLGG